MTRNAGQLVKILSDLAASDRLNAEEADAVLFASVFIEKKAREISGEPLEAERAAA